MTQPVRSVHQPHVELVIITKKNVTLTVAVIVPVGTDNVPVRDRVTAHVVTGELRSVHEPKNDRSIRIAPEKVGLSVSVVIGMATNNSPAFIRNLDVQIMTGEL